MDDDLKALAQEFRLATEELTVFTAARLEPGQPVPSSTMAELAHAQQRYLNAQRAYYRYLRDSHGWDPPAGVDVD